MKSDDIFILQLSCLLIAREEKEKSFCVYIFILSTFVSKENYSVCTLHPRSSIKTVKVQRDKSFAFDYSSFDDLHVSSSSMRFEESFLLSSDLDICARKRNWNAT